ncbi:preprotein translocase subunit YajC [Paeniglutamicibacter antarcticus]
MTENLLAQPATGGGGGFDPTILLMLAAFGLLIFMMMRGRKKAAKAQEQVRSNLAVGAEVMTQFGLFGTIASIDTDENKIVLEVSPGSFVTVHSQVVAKVVAPETPSMEIPDDASSLTSASVESAEEVQGNEGETPEETLRRLKNEENGPKA